MSIPFNNSIDEWATHFKLSPQAVEVLRDYIGLVGFDDLGIVYNDEQILEDLRNLLKRLDYVKFMNAKTATLQLLAGDHNFPDYNQASTESTKKIGSSANLKSEGIIEIDATPLVEDSFNESSDELLAGTTSANVYPTVVSDVYAEDEIPRREPVVAVPVTSVFNFQEHIELAEARSNQFNSLLNIIDGELNRRKEARANDSPSREKSEYRSSPVRPPPTPPRRRPDISDLRKFLLTSLAEDLGTVHCSFVRNRIGDHRHNPSYTVFLEDGHQFLLTAVRKNGVYRVCMALEDPFLKPEYCLAEIRTNYMGTEYSFSLFSPEENNNASNNSGAKTEIGAVCYERKAAFNQSPRCMDVVLPANSEEGRIGTWHEQQNNGDTLLTRIKRKNYQQLVFLKNRPPQWNTQLQCYVLNFKGRVTMASVKNFQLVKPLHENDVILQFGKVATELFVMDMKHPITPLQAFCLSLSSFDS